MDAHYLQYGVGLALEGIASGGDVCPPDAGVPCIFGAGSGLTLRMGYRSRGPWYAGGAYEASRHNSSNLLRLAILQQLRGELRHYVDLRRNLTPYATAGLGGAVYGNEFSLQTGAFTAFLGLGGEYQLSRTTVVGAAVVYRPLLFRRWTDGGIRWADRYLGFGLAHAVALDIVLELRQPLSRW